MNRHAAHCATAFKSITCFLPAGRAQAVLERLRKEKNVTSAYYHHARGSGLSTRRDKARPEYVEREMIVVLTPADQADDLFRFVFYAAGIDQPHAGMIIMTNAPCAEMLVPIADVPEES